MTSAPGQRLAAIVPLASGENRAALFDPLAGQSPLARVVRDALAAVADPAGVVVAVAEKLAGDVREHLAVEGLDAVGVTVVGGPVTRARCLAVALEHVVREPISAQFVLVYDVRQPLTSAEVRNRVVDRLTAGAPVVLPVLAVTDSVKAVDERGAITASLDRSTLRTVQYPRGFAADELAWLLIESAGEPDAGNFDEAVAATRAPAPITTVDGDAEAITVDLPHDASYLEAVIASRPPR